MTSTTISFNGYRQYDINIKKILQWLVATVRTSKVGDDILQQIVKKQGTKKTKKATKKSPKDEADVKITIENLQELAKAVTGIKAVKVPEDIVAAAKAIASFLLECHAWFLTHGLEAGSVKHPTEKEKIILETIDQNKVKVKQLSQAMENVSELLSRPHEEQSSETNEDDTELSELTSAAKNLTLGMSSDESTLCYQLEVSTQHEALALYYFLKDCTNVQLFVARTWQEFRDGTVGLLSASLLTNMGIAMIQEWSNELHATLPRLKNSNTRNMHKILIDTIKAKYCYCDDVLQQPSLGEMIGEVAFGDVSILTALSEYTHADMTKAFEFKKGKSKYYPDSYQKQDNTFFRCISQLGGLQHCDTHLQREKIKKSDDVHRASTDLGPLKEYYRVKIGAEVKDVEDDEVLTTQYHEYLNDTGIEHRGKSQKQWKQDIEEQLNFLQKASMHSDFQNLANKLEVKRESDVKEDAQFSLLENHPMLCGILLNETRNKFQEIAIDIAGEQGRILAVAHLYNAARESGCLDKSTSWIDMEWFIERQGSEWIFGGERPELPTDCVQSVCTALGLNPSTFEQDRIKASKLRGAFRRLHFLTRYLELDVKHETGGTGKVVGETKVAHSMLAKMRAMTSEWDGSAARTEALTPFGRALEQDEVAFNFNTLGLHMKCSRLLRHVRDACLTAAPKDYPADIFDKPANLNMIVVGLLRDLTGCERQNKSMFLKATERLSDLIEPDSEAELEQATRLTKSLKIFKSERL
ncbi:hypothetical protein HBH70_064330 [Parastagonospora nodorum]|nr:hypothetical protein HBH70_064330 [Parastagonospora nodorum]KAH5672329.1 hypothetical protein HBI23_062090 [Parastagonospora nodorum]KAH5772141.1 hypothetical protein HBI17_014960 [Parastagonospora nodorum]KAH6491346.1 hypothetical protein HBI58_052150 [Parastagonospora nodorum]